MFGKLLKNDLKAQWFSVFPVFVVMAILVAAAELLYATSESLLVRTLAGGLVFAILVVACLITVITVAILYNRSLFGNEGYLSLTLPVKTGQLIFSKTVSGLIWVFFVFALMVCSLLLWAHQVTVVAGEETVELSKTLLELFGGPTIDVLIICVFMFCIELAAYVLLVVQCIFFGITLSHVSPFSKLGKLGAIVFTFSCLILVNAVVNIVAEALPMGMVATADSSIFTSNIFETAAKHTDGVAFNLTSYVLEVIFALALNIPTIHLIKKEVNI